jgi:hypothetical protein
LLSTCVNLHRRYDEGSEAARKVAAAAANAANREAASLARQREKLEVGLTHSSKAHVFNPCTYKVKTRFQSLL